MGSFWVINHSITGTACNAPEPDRVRIAWTTVTKNAPADDSN